MKLLLGFVAGAAWGVFGACLNQWIFGRALAAGKDGRMLGANLLRVLVDLALLALVVLARGFLPFPFEMALAGTAAAIGMTGIFFAFRTAAGAGEKKEENAGSEEEKEKTGSD